ncbi:MAG: glycoside hydrolase, partial [Acidimicrobiales bacterium]
MESLGSKRRTALLGGLVAVVLAALGVGIDVSLPGSTPTTTALSGNAPGEALSAPIAGTVTVSTRPAQQMQGFGASGAWVGNDLIHFPKAVRNKLGAMLFSRKGIELSGYRYNIGGGGIGVTSSVRGPQTFLAPSGTYDWSADPGGRALLDLAKRYRVPELTAFVNSAPVRWTTNGKNC